MISFYLRNTGAILGSSVTVINILQIYKWFAQKHICSMLSIYLSSELIGYFIESLIIDDYQYYNTAAFYYGFGGSMMLFAIFDIFTFVFEPSKLMIHVD